MKIICDLDAIIVDLSTPWSAAYNKDYDDDLILADSTTWNTHEIVKPECGEKIYHYLKPKLFRDALPLPGAIDGINALCENHFVWLISTSPEGCCDAKVAWVKEWLPQLSKRLFTGHDKFMLKADVAIDDAPRNLRDYRLHHPAAKTVAIEYAYNKHCEVDFMAKDGHNTEQAWKSIVDFIG